MPPPTRDPWAKLARWTPARIALGRAGASLPTREVLGFALAHAKARDAVHAPFDPGQIARGLAELGLDTIEVSSDATERALYLRRPDYGRRLSQVSRALLEARGGEPVDLALVVGDGLSAAAVHAHAVPLTAAFLPHAKSLKLSLGPVVIAHGARVALGDEIGSLLRARLVAMLIGERPGLSSPDSLGVYLTFAPKPGRSDAERNCISNIRAEGLSYALAAVKLAWLVREALRRSLTGVALKDESDHALAEGRGPLILNK
ncbi:MAG TPA: ethanolamine ammonia-lyase subunit EutC [Hyphomicrobiaceae bacterium]|nr:ethanolamine ammonia-lyase subunit EutC [Hyphomicrobiaceae bacterium]